MVIMIKINSCKLLCFHLSEYCYGGPVGGSHVEPQFSYKVLPVDNYSSPASDSYEVTAANFDQDLHSGYNACQQQV